MIIGIDITALRQKNLSGIGKYLKNTLENLFEIDKENYYLLVSSGKKDLKINFDSSLYKNVSHIHVTFPNKLIIILNYLFNWPNIDKSLLKKNNIKLDAFWMPNISPCLVSKDTKLILTIHDLSYFLFPHFFNLKRKLWHFFVNPKGLKKRAEKIICVSENTKFDLINYFNISKDIVSANLLGISQNYKKLRDEEISEFRTKNKLENDFILYVGTIEPRKNLECVLKTFEKLSKDFENLDLVICGEIGWMKNSFNLHFNSIDENVKSRIKIIGYLEEGGLPLLYNSAKVFIWPSFYEGFGLPPLEAFACNCPVVSANNSSMTEVLGSNAVLVEAYDAESFYTAIKELLENCELYEFYKNKKIDEKYYNNWRMGAENLLRIFKNI